MYTKRTSLQRSSVIIIILMLPVLMITGCNRLSKNTSTTPIELTIPGIVLYYPFNGNANDMSGNRINGDVIGAVLTNDRFGKENSAYYFDGTGDSISFDASRMPIGSAPRTVSAWIKAESFPPAPENFQALGSRATVIGWGKDTDMQLSEMQITEKRLMYHVFNLDAWSVETVELNEWHHLVIVYTGSKVVLYVNGTMEEYDSKALNTMSGTGRIGAFSDPTVKSPLFPNGYDLSYFHGVIDDVSVFDEALTYEQVMSLYHQGGWK